MRLGDAVVPVIGSAQGIGRAIAVEAARRGAKVVLSVAAMETNHRNGETVRVDGAHRSPLSRSSVPTTRHGGERGAR